MPVILKGVSAAPTAPEKPKIPRSKKLTKEQKVMGVDSLVLNPDALSMAPAKAHPNRKPAYSDEQIEAIRKSIPAAQAASTSEEREKTISQVELLMLKGISNISVIAGILKLPTSTAHNHAKMVHARWEVLGSPQRHIKTKGEALSKLTLIENELWSLYSNAPGEQTGRKITILSQLQQVVDRKLIIQGLTPRVLESESVFIQTNSGEVSPQDMMGKHRKNVAVLGKLLKVMKGVDDGSDIIDAEPS